MIIKKEWASSDDPVVAIYVTVVFTWGHKLYN